jgi:tripartite-type tricarboxylate transporter receptor subunit TctC
MAKVLLEAVAGLLSHAAGIKLKHVPFGGAGPALTAILGGHVDAIKRVGKIEEKK